MKIWQISYLIFFCLFISSCNSERVCSPKDYIGKSTSILFDEVDNLVLHIFYKDKEGKGWICSAQDGNRKNALVFRYPDEEPQLVTNYYYTSYVSFKDFKNFEGESIVKIKKKFGTPFYSVINDNLYIYYLQRYYFFYKWKWCIQRRVVRLEFKKGILYNFEEIYIPQP